MLPLTKREGVGPRPEPAERFDPVPGAIVAEKYRIDRTIGEGGMGVVVVATHLGLEQQVAIKFLLPEAMRSQVAVERFLREARVAAKIRNEHVARVHDVGTLEGGVPYLVMEYLVGGDLGDVLADEGALAVDQACEIALQACEALAEVHAAGIVHRDLKPSNLFVTRRVDGSPVVKLLDFGISKLTTLGLDDVSADPALTATATIMGSPSYMSPEQLKSTKEVDARADVWSLGAVLYEALTGKPAFRGETVPQVCAMIASEDPPAPSTFREGIAPELDAAVLRALAKDADRRIPLVELAEVLARFAPDRARSSLERIEAVLGAPVRSRSPSVMSRDAKDALPVLPLATSEPSRTVSAWGRERRGRGTGGGSLVLLALVVVGVLIAWITGNFNVTRLRGQVAGATSLVNSAASAVTSAVSSVVGSSLPNGTPFTPALSSPSPAPPSPAASEIASGVSSTSAEDGAAEESEPEDAEAPTVASPSSSGTGRAPTWTPAAGAHPPPARTHPPKTRHPGKPSHRHH